MKNLYLLIDRLSNTLVNEKRKALAEFGLQPVQLDALRYLSMANKHSDNAISVSEYLGHTKGTISQSIKVLERKALVHKTICPEDKRVLHIKVTTIGKHILSQLTEQSQLHMAITNLSNTNENALIRSLNAIQHQINSKDVPQSFGQCFTCIHYKPGIPAKCTHFEEVITEEASLQICRAHQEA
ncbi:MarR family winged helix-turn-helix transcriptional regulator [Thalassotalea piscium]|uniref:DNA-binding MarR family transcriptional regulator n=1 Tax=Thalassotalea piscium TaxID=1230533 RepID=A0A7X0NFL7_9GAMM|nr:MarR family transcriptional regulator [Thalassotalea piscium]MBB6542545.1 DNA-binding MarR family transcriptional regulator [Thalassotalea piscium]